MTDEVRLEGGKLVLFTRNGIWQARVSAGNSRYVWKSLKTINETDARRSGIKLFYEIGFKIDRGLPVQSRTLNDVLDEYIEYRERDHELGNAAKRGSSNKHTSAAMLRQIHRVSKFWREYAGKKAIETIDDHVLRDYVPWRKTYYHGKPAIHRNAKPDPTDKTIQWDIMLGKMVLRYAKDQRYLAEKPLPAFAFTPKNKRVRPAFTPAEFKKIRSTLRTWIDEADNERWKASRWLLHDYVLTLGMSGLRPGEANKLKVRDVERYQEGQNDNIRIKVSAGKTGERLVLPHHELMKIFQERTLRDPDRDEDSWQLAMPDGSKITTLIDQFNTFLKHAKLTHNSAGEKYTLYSLRHYYAVRSLERTDVYDVARNMGTSVAMIEQYYGKHSITPERARKLSGYESQPQRAAERRFPRLYKLEPLPENSTTPRIARRVKKASKPSNS